MSRLLLSGLLGLVSVTTVVTYNCLPAAWLPVGSNITQAEECEPYDGSRLPDCSQFSGQVNTTSFYHVHEYDCGLFWECGPANTLCLFACAPCNLGPRCPDGRLQFDCRYPWPLGPVCDWADRVGCLNCLETCQAADCPEDQNCDPTTECQCSDCRVDSDCTGGQVCCDRNCEDSCDDRTTTVCPTDCCQDADCPPGETCEDGSCVPVTTLSPTTTTCPTECCSDVDCPDDQICEEGSCIDKTPTTTVCPTDCCSNTDCPAGEQCVEGVCVGSTTPCPTECCADTDCQPGYLCEDGSCVQSCIQDSNCEGYDAVCNHPEYDNCQYCDGQICRNGCAADVNCPASRPLCTGIHGCGAGFPGLVKVSVTTYDCTGCPDGSLETVEGGLTIQPSDPTGHNCSSNGLDNLEDIDYTNGMTAEFMAGEDDGLGGCEYANLNFHVTGGSVTWTGTGTWTGATHNPICFYFYDDLEPFYKIYNCCNLKKKGLAQNDSTDLENCRMCVLGNDCD